MFIDNKFIKHVLLLILAILAGALSFYSANMAVLAFLFIFLMFFSLKWTEIGVYFLMIYIPLEPFLLKFIEEDARIYAKYGQEIVLIILVLITVFKYFKKEGLKYKKTPIDIPILFFILISFVSFVFNWTSPLAWIFGLRQLLRYVLLYYVVIYSGFEKKIIRSFVFIILGMLLLQSLIGFSQIIAGKSMDNLLMPEKAVGVEGFSVSESTYQQFWESGQRVFATMGRYDMLGIFICISLIVVLGLLFELKSKKYNNFLYTLFGLSCFVLIYTYSRMAWIGLVIGFLFISMVIKRNKKIIILFFVFVLLLVSYFGVYVAMNDIEISRLDDFADMSISSRVLMIFSLSDFRNSYRYYGRLYFIEKTITQVVKNNPIIGVGLGYYGSGVALAMNNTDIYDEYGLAFGVEDREGQIDNNWFSIWGETGTLGFVSFILIFISLFRHSYKSYKKSQDDFDRGIFLAHMALILTFSFHCFLGPYLEARILSMYFWVISGTAVALGENNLKKYD